MPEPKKKKDKKAREEKVLKKLSVTEKFAKVLESRKRKLEGLDEEVRCLSLCSDAYFSYYRSWKSLLPLSRKKQLKNQLLTSPKRRKRRSECFHVNFAFRLHFLFERIVFVGREVVSRILLSLEWKRSTSMKLLPNHSLTLNWTSEFSRFVYIFAIKMCMFILAGNR